MQRISFDRLPIEPTVTIVNPDGSDLITTNNPIAVLYARLEIKHNKWSGYKIRTRSGCICEIDAHGKIHDWPETNEIPGDVFSSLLYDLL